VWKDRQSIRTKEGHKYEKELKKLRDKRDRTDDLLIQGAFDKETYKRKSDEIRGEISVTKMDISDSKTETDDIEGCVLYCKHFLLNLADLWAASDHNLKQRFQTLIFPDLWKA
jgi:hypothetical protein